MAKQVLVGAKTPARGTTVSKCNCEHKFQDKQYGAGMRLKNNRPGDNKPRCTVCGRID